MIVEATRRRTERDRASATRTAAWLALVVVLWMLSGTPIAGQDPAAVSWQDHV
ncbi:MAG: hypothetical protein IT182_19670 [Acidobacteria bacterium]|nr:hypothetical protein [Acidobacteriota bacterium]